MRARSLTSFVIGLFSATALVLGGVFALLLVSVTTLRDDDTQAQRSSDLFAQSFAVERSVVDLETGLRGFLLTRQSQFLQPYAQAKARLPAQIETLRGLARSQLEREQISGVSGAISNYISGYAAPLIATGGRLSVRRTSQVALRGKRLIDSLRARLAAFGAGELVLRERQRRNATDGTSKAIALAAIGLIASLGLLLGQTIYLLVRILRPMRAVSKAAEGLASGDLNERVPEVGLGEVARLAQSFNEMAGALQARDIEISEARTQLERAAAEATEASALKSNFLANMSHEIRTPLNGVVGMLSLLADTGMSEEQLEYVEVALSSSDALMNVVNDVLDIAKIEAGGLEIESRDFDLHEMVESSCDMVAAGALSKGLELQSFVHDGVPRSVRGDRMRVGQVLSNLLSNAVKFTPEGEVVVEVSVAERSGDVAFLCFEVRDTGIGIAPDRIKRLFDPFTQADVGTTREFGGTGLGLTISLELTRLMGGTIEAESEVGKGSVFRVMIPFETSPAELREPIEVVELRGLRVLVVDDNATNRRVFEAYAASWGMRPEVVGSAEAALGTLERAVEAGEPFDVALLDLNMPGASGIELARRISASSALGHTRLILLTSSGQTHADEPSTGISSRLMKPVRQSRLLDAISAAMASEPHARAVDATSEQPAEPASGGSRILVAEDQEVNWMLIERLLSKRGHSAANARDGRRVLEMIEKEPFDLILMDCQMPLLDGYDTAREIRQREAGRSNGHIPIVAMTANAMPGARERCIDAGMDDYMAKPISVERLDALLDQWLGVPVPHGNAGALDRLRLDELRLLFPDEEMTKLLRDLEDEMSAQLDRLATALPLDDQTSVADAAHRIKNSALVIGAGALADAATRLEALADGQAANGGPSKDTAARDLVAQWEAAHAAIRAEVEPGHTG
jgi:two-component system sensor histidine kinase/response regulator